MNTIEILSVTLISLLAVISPGPDFIIVTRNSLLYSKKVGLATALGIAAGNIWWVGASLLGISYIIAKAVVVFNIMKWLGAIYLFYIGMRAIIGSFKKQNDIASDAETKNSATAWHGFKMGLIANLLNPKCALFFVSLFSVVVSPNTSVGWRAFYGIEVMLIALCWFSLLATLLSTDKVKAIFNRFAKWMDRVTGAILVALGIKLAVAD